MAKGVHDTIKSLDLTDKIFRFHCLLGADYKLCIRKLGGDKGNFFHAVYRIQQKLGRVFAEVEPFALFPLSEYFHGVHQDRSVKATIVPVAAGVLPIRPPIRAFGPQLRAA